MTKVLINDQSLYDIADSIRGKLGVETLYLPSDMADAIESIETGTDLTSEDEGKVVVEDEGSYVLAEQTSLSVSANGTYDTTTNDEVVVEVSGGGSQSGVSLSYVETSADSTYGSSVSGYGYFSSATAIGMEEKNWWGAASKGQHWWMIEFEQAVRIDRIRFSNYWNNDNSAWLSTDVTFQGGDGTSWTDLLMLTDLDQSETQREYQLQNASEYTHYRFVCNNTGSTLYYTGLGKIQMYGVAAANLITKTITQNGTYDPADDNADGYSEVTVNVSGGGSAGSLYYKIGDMPMLIDVAADSVFGPTSAASHFIRPMSSDGSDVKLDLSTPFEIGCKFKLGDAVGSNGRNVFGSSDSYYHCPAIAVHNDKIAYYVTTSGASWTYSGISITPSGYTPPINTWIFVKLAWDGTDFSFYVDDGSDVYESTLEGVTPYYNQNYQFEFAGQNKSSYSLCVVSGTYVDLSNTYLKQGDSIIWGGGHGGHGTVLVSKTITQNGTYDPADDQADGYSEVTVNVGGSPSEGTLCDFDFVNQVYSHTPTIVGATVDNNGLHFTQANQYVNLIDNIRFFNTTIILDMGDMNLVPSSYHRSLITFDSSQGYIFGYRSTGKWSMYVGSWAESTITELNFASNKEVAISFNEIVASNKILLKIYVDGALTSSMQCSLSDIVSNVVSFELGNNRTASIGGDISGVTIKRARIVYGDPYSN